MNEQFSNSLESFKGPRISIQTNQGRRMSSIESEKLESVTWLNPIENGFSKNGESGIPPPEREKILILDSQLSQGKREVQIISLPTSCTGAFIAERRKAMGLSALIIKLYIVLNFIMKLKEYACVRKPKWLAKRHFEMINDKSFSFESYLNISKKIDNDKSNMMSVF